MPIRSPISPSAALCAKTPSITVISPEQQTLRTVDYHRAEEGQVERRIHIHCHDLSLRVTEQWDPRQYKRLQEGEKQQANISTLHSLSGRALATRSVDAGNRTTLFNVSGKVAQNWDSRATQNAIDYDALGRPQTLWQSLAGQPRQVVQRCSYGDASADKSRNHCGHLLRQDDCAGTLLNQQLSIDGTPLAQTRHFLREIAQPDWPQSLAEREAIVEPRGYSTTLLYDAVGQQREQVDAAGNVRRYGYTVDGAQYSATLQYADGTICELLRSICSDAYGNIQTQTCGNGIVTDNEYCPMTGRLSRLRVRRGGQAMQDLNYEHDPVGNIVRIADAALPTRHYANQRIEPIIHYTYDSLYQLTATQGRESASANSISPGLPELGGLNGPGQLLNYTQRYDYDAGGNLTRLRHQGQRSYTRDMQVEAGSNRAVAGLESAALMESGAFDGNGNLTHLTHGHRLEWDGFNQLASVRTITRASGSDEQRYQYDGAGQRLRKVDVAKAKNALIEKEVRYLPGLEIHTDSAGQCLHIVTQQTGRTPVRALDWISGKPDGVLAQDIRYSFQDHLQSCALEFDGAAELVSQEGYYPFAGTAWRAARSVIDASYKTIRYSGKERDSTGLYYYGLRYFAPWLQRWLNPDPAGIRDGLNLYSMVGNNPIRYADARGLERLDYLDLASAPADDASVVAAAFQVNPGVSQQYNSFSARTAQILDAPAQRQRQIDELERNKKKGDANKLKKSPLKFSKTALKGFAAHAGIAPRDGSELTTDFVNFEGSLAAKNLFPGVELMPAAPPPDHPFSVVIPASASQRTKLAFQQDADFGNYRVVDPQAFMQGIEQRYEAGAVALHDYTRQRITSHLANSNYVIPIKAGIAGLHAEVQALNDWISRPAEGRKTEQVIADSFVFTQRLVGIPTGQNVVDFPACYNCSGILPPTLNVMTGRLPERPVTNRTRRASSTF